MLDAIMLGFALGSFLILIGYTYLCDQL